MVVGNEFVVCREQGDPFLERDKAEKYIRDHLAEFDVKKVMGDDYPKITTLFNNKWDSLYSFNLHQNIDIWLQLGEHLVIDGSFDTYVCMNTYKANRYYNRGKRIHLYIKFTKSLITELCDISGMTKEQACALIQVFAMVGSRDSSFDKMCLDFTNNGSDSVIAKIVNQFTTVKSICDRIADRIYDYLIKAFIMDNAINLFINSEIEYCKYNKLDVKNFVWSDFVCLVELTSEELRGCPMGSSLLTLEEIDDVIYTDNPQKVFKQKGLSKYLSKETIIKTHETIQSYVAEDKGYDFYDVKITPSNIAGLSHFGGKLFRIL